MVYELTGVLAHILDEDEAAEKQGAMREREGHLVAHIRVRSMSGWQYLSEKVFCC